MKLNQLVDKESGRLTRPVENYVSSSAVLDSPITVHSISPDGGLSTGHFRTPLTLAINGASVTILIDPATTLTEVLREHLELTGTKIGCDRGACSACTVWIDGEVAASCMTFALDVRGKKITTIEGLARDGRLHPVQQAFIEHDAMQCGFCTPGMVMSCAALVEHNPNPGLDDIKKAISGHLCRCGTYNNIFKAVISASGESRKENSNA